MTKKELQTIELLAEMEADALYNYKVHPEKWEHCKEIIVSDNELINSVNVRTALFDVSATIDRNVARHKEEAADIVCEIWVILESFPNESDTDLFFDMVKQYMK